MGASCGPPSNSSPDMIDRVRDWCEPKAVSSSELIDLPMPSIDSEDKVLAWEQSTPFARCSFKAYMAQLKKAQDLSDALGDVKLKALQACFLKQERSSSQPK